MLVPRPRLLFWTAAILLPCAALCVALPAMLATGASLIAVFVLIAGIDAALASGAVAGIALALPAVVRLSKDRAGRIELRLRNPGQRARRLRVGLALPPEIPSSREELWAALPADAEWSRLEWGCQPRQRGSFRLTQACLEAGSPLGLWAWQAAVPVSCELRVYPNLLPERRNLAALFLNRGTFGLHAQRQVGKGREFEKLREYIPGDSFEDVHWKATAKRGHPVTKVFQIERTQEVYVVIDASRLSGRPAKSFVRDQSSAAANRTAAASAADHGPLTADSALERFMTAALVLGLAAEQQGDLFGVLTFTDRIESFIRARNGKSHYNACRDALYTLQPKIATPDFDEVAAFIRLRLRRRALLVFLTALDDPVLAESFVRHVDLVSRQHLVLVNMLKPAGAEPLFSRTNVTVPDELYERLGGHLQWHNLRELEKVLQRRGVRLSLLEHEKLSVQLVTQYLGVKQRQLI